MMPDPTGDLDRAEALEMHGQKSTRKTHTLHTTPGTLSNPKLASTVEVGDTVNVTNFFSETTYIVHRLVDSAGMNAVCETDEGHVRWFTVEWNGAGGFTVEWNGAGGS